MTTLEIFGIVVTGYAAFWALYLVSVPLIARLGRSERGARKGIAGKAWPAIAVIVPARNAAGTIEGCLHALRACNYPVERCDIYVVADHCSDDTAERAEAAGAIVLIRREGPKGKTYTIAWALNELANRGVTPDLYVIVDATAEVEANFLSAMAERWQRGDHIISGHAILSAQNRSWYARCLGLMLAHRSLQSWSRERLGLSALLGGRGMAYSRNYIQRFGWSLALPRLAGSHPTEDWRHAVKAVEQGYRVAFADDARVATPLRGSLTEATRQGARWERGRFINAGTYALRLLLFGIRKRDPVKLFAALDAMQPPVAILGALSLVVAVAPVLAPGASMSGIASFVPLMLVGLYALGVVFRGRNEGISLSTVIWAPVYVAWRCITFVLAWGFLDRIDLRRRRKDAAGDLVRSTPSPAPDGKSSQPPMST